MPCTEHPASDWPSADPARTPALQPPDPARHHPTATPTEDDRGLIVACAWYLAVVTVLSLGQRRLERHFGKGQR